MPAALLAAAGLPVETKPPKLYRQHIEPVLTPLDTILKLPATAAAAGDSGLILLDERIVAVDEEGRRTTAWHFAYKTLTEAGIKTNSEDIYRFDKREQKAFLVLAETIQPDGSRQAVQPNAVLLQSPQRQAQYSLYDDQSELKLIFPNVRPGSITHGIIVIEDLVTKVPGELCQTFSWGSSWATARSRFEVNLPKALDGRLKIERLGANLPPETKPPGAAGRVRHAWLFDQLRGERYEPGRPPASQVGPSLQLTTIRDWDAFAAWYRGLLRGRDQLKPELARLVDEWCKDFKAAPNMIQTLHTHVADDVRYVGLEFGAAAHQPHDCNEVWSLQYGDCKDKANLLVAMLRYKGVDASIALVSTEHLGLVNRRSPGYQPFNHAIVAVPQVGGGYLFCDPTIAYSPPGMISNRTADRDVLIISPKKAEWVRTPPATAGTLNYAFDLKLGDSGELSGWLTFTADGYYGATERRHYSHLEPQEVRSTLSDVVRGFFPGAEVADTERLPSDRGEPYVVKAYFTVPGTARNAGNQRALSFPVSKDLLPDLGNTPERQTTYFLDRDVIKVDATILLPSGYQAPLLPPEFSVNAGSALMYAGWTAAPGSCRAELELEMRSAAVRRDEFGTLYQARQALQAWLDHPLVLEPGSGVSQPSRDVALDFPLMPTGDGQINLADTRYPYNGDPVLRRRALERTIQYFPNDPNTVFRANGRLAILDWDAGHNAAAAKRLESLLADYAGKVSLENYAWARNVAGLVLRDLGRDAEALAHLRALATDSRLSADRRATAGPPAAALLAKSDPAAAIALLREIAALPDGATPAVESQLAQLLLETGQAPALATRLQQIVQSRPDSAEEELAGLLRAAQEWPDSSAPEGPALRLASLVAELVPQPGATLKQLLAKSQASRLWQKVKTAAKAVAAQPPLAAWTTAAAPLRASDYDQAIAEADGKNDGAAGFRAALQALLQLNADDGFPRRLWRAANYADWAERQGITPLSPDVADRMLDLCEQLPADNEYYFEGLLLRASRLHRAQSYAAEITLLQSGLSLPGLPEQYLLALTRRVAGAREAQGDYPEALRLYASVEQLARSYQSAAETVLRQVFIALHLGRDAEALRGIELLRLAPAEVTRNMAGRDQAAELIQLAQSGQAEAVWQNGRAWWPQWRLLATPFLGATDTPGAVVPVVASLEELGTTLGQARRDKDTKACFTTLDVLLSGARWLPSYGFEITSVFTLTAGIAPAQIPAFRSVIISILEGPHPPAIANAATSCVQLAAHYLDAGLPAKALGVIHAYLEHPPAGGEALVGGMTRLWGLAALEAKIELAEAAAAIDRQLSDPQLAEQRATAVRILADLHHRLGHEAEERDLLKRELANPVIVADAAGTRSLQARLDQLVGERELARESLRWRDAVGVPWYDFAEPASLADPRLRNLNAVLEQPDKHFLPAEKVKLYLLVAQDPLLPLAQRQAAVRSAASTLLMSVPTWTRFNQVTASVVDNPTFDLEMRVNTLWLALVYSASLHRPDVYRRWRSHPLYERFNEALQMNVTVLDQWIEHDPTSANSLLNLGTKFAATDVTNFRAFVLTDVFAAIIDLGDLAAAEKFLALMAEIKTAPDFEGSLQTRRLELARQLRVARLTGRVHDRLVELMRHRYPALADKLPDVYADLRIGPQLPVCSPAETLQACLYLINSRQFSRKNFEFWGTLVRNLPRNPETDAFACDLMAAAMGAAETDELKSELVEEFSGNLDLDRPPVAAAVRNILSAVIDPGLYPDASLRAKTVEVELARRVGTLTDVDAFFAGLTHPGIPFLKQSINLRVLTQRKDLPALARVVDGLSADLLLSPTFVQDTLPALTLLGRNEEAQLARTVARSELRKLVAQSWLDANGRSIPRIGALSALLHEPELVPQAWADELGRSLTDPFARLQVRLIAAAARDDWRTMAAASAGLNREYPTHYHFYWWRGLAEARLGNKAEARQALEVYTQYSKDEREYPAALALLKELGK
ncbi:MAG TPA: DUF3857 domain-containing protein [Lacunisphaera sp.]|nr:DUF3857 domain-containing protein [Lacunisphaera sp.]